MSNFYECPICYSVNHVTHFQCSICGTVPARYSWTGKPMKSESMHYAATEVVVARGAVRASQHYAARYGLKTMPLEYYAQPSADGV